MSRKGENIRKRKDGRWEGRYKTGFKADGTARYKSLYGKTYKEVKTKLYTAKCSEDIPASSKDPLFSEILNLWLETNKVRLKGGTKYRYEYLIKTHIMPELGNLKLSQMNAAKINAFLLKKLTCGRLDQAGGLAPSYVNSIRMVIHSVMNYATAEQLCAPLKTPIYKPFGRKTELKILSFDEQKALEQHIKTELTPTKIGIYISLYTGLRIGEICALSWNDVDLKNQVLHVRHTVARINSNDAHPGEKTHLIIDEPKTKSSVREIPISSALLPILLEYKNQSTSHYLASDNENYVSPRTFEYRFHRVLESGGVRSVNYHTLRHTFATRCIEAGVDVKSLSEMLGHANVSVTLNTYVHSSIHQKRNQLEKLVALTATD